MGIKGTEKSKVISRFTAAILAVLMTAMVIIWPVRADAAIVKNREEPDLTAEAALLYCNTTGEIVYQKNADEQIYPYSITKLMTALLTVESRNLNDKVTVSKEATMQGGSSMLLQEGEVVTVRQLLYGLLILSGNDAAYALAESSPEGEAGFVQKMNERARALGCTNTHFNNPNGIQDPDHYTTASDYIKIANAALANKTVRKIAGTKKYEMAATNKQDAREFDTHLDLLTDKNSGVVAGKTGFFDVNDCSIAARYKKDGLTLTLILLRDQEDKRPEDMETMFAYARKYVKHVKVTKKGQYLGRFWIKGGAETHVEAYAEKTALAYPKDGKKDSTKIKLVKKSGVKSPLRKGEVVGRAYIYSDGKKTGSVPVIVKENVRKGWFPSEYYISNIGTIAIAAGVLLLIDLIVIGRSRKKKKEAEAAEEEMKH